MDNFSGGTPIAESSFESFKHNHQAPRDLLDALPVSQAEEGIRRQEQTDTRKDSRPS